VEKNLARLVTSETPLYYPIAGERIEVENVITDANGGIAFFPTILVQVRLVRDDTPWSNRIDEFAIVKQHNPSVPRLSGVRIRRVLYFGTAPGNHLLAVSATKGGLTSLF
jgi:hypothetical protein